MYSEEMMKYLYSYNMPHKSEDTEDLIDGNNAGKNTNVLNTLKKIKNIYAGVPVKFNHE